MNPMPDSDQNTPLTKSQRELLETYIDCKEGIYTDVINESKSINAKTKVALLEFALTIDSKAFYVLLDRLFTLSQKDYELVRAYKVLNDLYANNEVTYDIYGTRNAVDHYFHGFGQVNQVALQVEMKQMIRLLIQKMINDPHYEQLQGQDILQVERDSHWRAEPNSPRDDMNGYGSEIDAGDLADIDDDEPMFRNGRFILPEVHRHRDGDSIGDSDRESVAINDIIPIQRLTI